MASNGALHHEVQRRGPDYTSPQEKKLLRRFAQGKSNQQIAEDLGGTADRIEALRQMILKKFEIRSPAELMMVADKLAAWPKPKRG